MLIFIHWLSYHLFIFRRFDIYIILFEFTIIDSIFEFIMTINKIGIGSLEQLILPPSKLLNFLDLKFIQ